MKHTLWYREGNRLEYKPVQPEAADRRIVPAQGADVLTIRTMPHRTTHEIPASTATTRTRTRSRTCRTTTVELDGTDRMLLDALMRLKAIDDTLSFRR